MKNNNGRQKGPLTGCIFAATANRPLQRAAAAISPAGPTGDDRHGSGCSQRCRPGLPGRFACQPLPKASKIVLDMFKLIGINIKRGVFVKLIGINGLLCKPIGNRRFYYC